MNEEQELLELYKNKDIDKLFDKVGKYYHKWLNNTKKLDFYKQEIERLKKREQECIDHYLVASKYSSELESKIVELNNIIDNAIEESKLGIQVLQETKESFPNINCDVVINKYLKPIYKALKGSDKE